MFIWNMLSLNGVRPFKGKPNTKIVRAWPKVDSIISFRAGVTYGIGAIGQFEMGEHAQAHRGHQQEHWVLRGGECDVPHCLGMDNMMCVVQI